MSLAITEKRPQQRPGGCVGILVHLFDWNRRLAKKKLFSNKFLPPVRATKRSAKKLCGDDKMPLANKLLLIADENRGGFPAAKEPESDERCSAADDPGNGMRAPGLVARLMGLESMPAVKTEKPRKALDSERFDGRVRSCEFQHRLDQDLCQEVGGHGKLESRPQKLQKIGAFLERGPVGAARFSPEMLSKSMLSRTKRQHHKLASPVKSPRLLSRGGTARLMQAAAKILEPGLQSRNKSRCALTYTGSLQDKTVRVNDTAFSSEEALSDSLVGSCRSCGSSLMEVSDFSLGSREPVLTEYEPSASDCSSLATAASSHSGSLERKMKTPLAPNGRNRTASIAVQAKSNAQNKACVFTERKCYVQIDKDQCKPWQCATSKSTLMKNNLGQNKSALARDRMVHETRASRQKQSGRKANELNGTRDFIALNRNLNDCSRMRSTPKVPNNLRVEMEKKGWEKNTARKRRPIGGPQIENGTPISSTFAKQSNIGSSTINRKGTGLINGRRSINRNCVSSELPKTVNGNNSTDSKDNGAVSFTLGSPMRHDSKSLTHQEAKHKSRASGEFTHGASYCKKLVLDAKTNNLSSQREITLRGDKLSNLLEEKIKELTHLSQEELATGNALPARSTASILEELISALTTDAPLPHNNVDQSTCGFSPTENAHHGRDISDCTILHNQILDANKNYQEEAKAGIDGAFLASVRDQPSPISILDCSFSNDSSLGSLSCISGSKSHLRLTESFDQTSKLDLDIDLLDSATSTNTRESYSEKILHSVDEKSSLHGSQLHEVGISETKLSHATEAISNGEMLFENNSFYESDGTIESSTDPFLLSLLEIVADSFCKSSIFCSGFVKEENQLKELLFDCIIECLDSRYSCFFKSGWKAWLKLPAFLSRDRLLSEVPQEIKGWGDLAGKVVDALIEKETAHSTLQWTEFKIEAVESGIEIENDILKALVDELVIDLNSG